MQPGGRNLPRFARICVNDSRKSITAFVGMGNNLGDRLAMLQRALNELNAVEGVVVERLSSIYETEAHLRAGQASQPDHLNAAAQIRTRLSAEDLLHVLQHIEQAVGRDPSSRNWSPRLLDLDLLIYGRAVIESEDLTIPHPRMAERRFVLQPLADLVHNLVVPGADNATVSDLLGLCPDTRRVERTGLRLVVDPRSQP